MCIPFQSAGRIWGFRNWPAHRRPGRFPGVSIRRADLGLSEPPITRNDPFHDAHVSIRRADLGLSEHTQHSLNPFDEGVSIRRADLGLSELGREFGDDGGDHVSIRRADLGLSELESNMRRSEFIKVSIRRADLGLSELGAAQALHRRNPQFQSAGRIWGFRNARHGQIVTISDGVTFQSAGRIGGFRNPARMWSGTCRALFQSAGRIWGFRNAPPSAH